MESPLDINLDADTIARLDSVELIKYFKLLWPRSAAGFARSEGIDRGNFTKWIQGTRSCISSENAVRRWLYRYFNIDNSYPKTQYLTLTSFNSSVIDTLEKRVRNNELDTLIFIDGDQASKYISQFLKFVGDKPSFHVIVTLARIPASPSRHYDWCSYILATSTSKNAVDLGIVLEIGMCLQAFQDFSNLQYLIVSNDLFAATLSDIQGINSKIIVINQITTNVILCLLAYLSPQSLSREGQQIYSSLLDEISKDNSDFDEISTNTTYDSKDLAIAAEIIRSKKSQTEQTVPFFSITDHITSSSGRRLDSERTPLDSINEDPTIIKLKGELVSSRTISLDMISRKFPWAPLRLYFNTNSWCKAFKETSLPQILNAKLFLINCSIEIGRAHV